MAIVKSVGKKGTNDKVDVKVIQAALNLSQSSKFKLAKHLKVDGAIGKNTYGAIEAFQATVVGLSKPDGRVDPNGKTLRKLHSSVTKGLSEDALLAIMAHGTAANIKVYLPLLKFELPKYQINKPLRVAHFLAQVGHESGSFRYTEELASGAAYENRTDLGNVNPGDGVRFKGRGLIQLTGRNNYRDFGKVIGIDLLKQGNETLVASTPKYALIASLWFWDSRHLNRLADHDNLRSVTRRVNGGYNGIADRQLYLNRAKFFLV